MDYSEEQNLIELTVFIRGLDPLVLFCSLDQPIVETLFRALAKNSQVGSIDPSELLFLEIDSEPSKAIYFPRDRLVAIESTPPVDQALLEELILL